MKKLSIVVIDDSPIISKRIKDMLDESKAVKQLFMADNFSKGLALIDKHNPEVVLLDINLPDGRGLKNLYDLRITRPATKVIIITNQEYEKYEQVSMQLGAYCYLDKSYDFHKLPSVIEQICRAYGSFFSA
jgi:DNA-binding NarL/FixJ family response regulator